MIEAFSRKAYDRMDQAAGQDRDDGDLDESV
jgi:hypothetical protein